MTYTYRLLAAMFAGGLALGVAGVSPLIAQAQAPPPAPTPAASPAPASPDDQGTPAVPAAEATQDAPFDAALPRTVTFRCHDWSHRPVFRLGQDHRVRAGDSVRDAVVVFGSVVVDGEVCGDLVVIFGNAELRSTAYVRDELTVVGGLLTVAEGAKVDGGLVVVGGSVNAPGSFEPGGEQVLIGLPIVGDHVLGVVPWITRGLLYGRLLVPDLTWNWYIVLITLFVVVVLNLLFPRATGMATGVIQARPLSAFAAGLLVLLLAGPVVTLLAVTVVGIALIPFLMCGMFAGWLVGSIAVARWVGASLVPQDDPGNSLASTRSLVIGFVVKSVAYMIPLVGLTTFALAGVLGLGAATMALIGAFRAENPRKTPPRVPPVHTAADEEAAPVPPELPPELPASTGAADLRRFPRGTFLERLGAFTLDVVLIALLNGALDLTDREGAFLFLLVGYHVVLWAWKGTTIGGIITQLRVVRVDGRPLELTDALVRGLTGIFSLGMLGLGCLWILKDEQRQAWHDLVAGTLVVRVPRGWPLP